MNGTKELLRIFCRAKEPQRRKKTILAESPSGLQTEGKRAYRNKKTKNQYMRNR